MFKPAETRALSGLSRGALCLFFTAILLFNIIPPAAAGLYDDSNGSIGIGTVSPSGIVGSRFEVRGVKIKDVQPGMMALSLNEETGQIGPRRINALLDMGVKPVFKLTTKDGRSIRTTGNHPYLVKGEISEKDRKTFAQQQLNDLQARGLLKEEFSEEREFAQSNIIWEKALMMQRQFGFDRRNTFVQVNSHSDFPFQRLETNREFISQGINPFINSIYLLREFISQGINPFINSINLLIQAFDFHLDGGYIGSDRLQFRNNQLLNHLFKIYRCHTTLLSQLKDTISGRTCQARNSGIAYASAALPVEGIWLKAIYLATGFLPFTCSQFAICSEMW